MFCDSDLWALIISISKHPSKTSVYDTYLLFVLILEIYIHFAVKTNKKANIVA